MNREDIPLVLDLNGNEIGIKGYYIKDIEKHLTKEEYDDFNNYMNGQTVGLVKGKTIVYRWDYERWERCYNA